MTGYGSSDPEMHRVLHAIAVYERPRSIRHGWGVVRGEEEDELDEEFEEEEQPQEEVDETAAVEQIRGGEEADEP
jgi:hypothetical protein